MELYFALSGLFNAITSTILGLSIYLKNTKAKVNKTFTFFVYVLLLGVIPTFSGH